MSSKISIFSKDGGALASLTTELALNPSLQESETFKKITEKEFKDSYLAGFKASNGSGFKMTEAILNMIDAVMIADSMAKIESIGSLYEKELILTITTEKGH